MWKDIKKVDQAAERTHQQNAKVRAEGETLHSRLDQAFKNHQQAKPMVNQSAQPKEGIGLRTTDNGPRLPAGEAGTTDNGQRTNSQSLMNNAKPVVATSPSTQPSQIYKTPSSL